MRTCRQLWVDPRAPPSIAILATGHNVNNYKGAELVILAP